MIQKRNRDDILRQKIIELLEEMPIIAAVKNDEDCQKALSSDCKVIFLLYGTICNVGQLVDQIKAREKIAIVHLDLIEGLEHSVTAVEFIAACTEADGIISTKSAVIRAAKERGLFAVQRFFLLDSLAFESISRHIRQGTSDMVEILPGVMPKVIKKLTAISPVPVIAGGLILDKEDVICALSAGASAVSTSMQEVWKA